MCDIRPGTRCAYDMRSKVQKRTRKLEDVIAKHGEGSPEAELAQGRLDLAVRQYDATKEGIKKIEKLITQTDYDEELIHRYKEARMTNQVQTLSVKEIKTGRQESVASLSSQIYNSDPHEAFSTFESARTFQENRIVDSLSDEHLSPVSQEIWSNYLNSVRHDLASQNKLTPENERQLKALHSTPAPPAYIFSCYSSYSKLEDMAAKHKKQQQKMIATLIGSDEETVREAHSKLRKAYLTLESPPTIPEQWVRGESPTAGTMNSPRVRFAPSDPASSYANYTLMYNSDVLPDYQKRAHNFITIEQEEGTVSLSRYSPTGKLLYTENYSKENPNLMTQIKQESEGSTLITEKPGKSGLNLQEIASQHLDLPSYNRNNVKAALKSDSDNIVELFIKTVNSSKKAWNSKPDRREVII